MIVKSIDLKNFRNYEQLHLEFSDDINIFYGYNAQGKTNLLEAVCLATTNKSHRLAKDKEMISFNEEEAHIKLIAEKNENEYRIDMHLKKNKNKGIAVNSVPLKKAGDFLGILNCVVFSPEDLQIVKEGPSERRRFIDNELFQVDKIYLNAFIKYKKSLDQRNKLLKDLYFNPEIKDTLEIWDEQLLNYGKKIIEIRKKFIKEMNEIVGPIHSYISGNKEELQLFYEPDATIEEYENKLKASREKDIKFKTTSVGPHRDDMSFILNSIDARVYGSQGQQRTCALSLKIGEIEFVKRRIKDTPLLLLDDVLSELDEERQNYILESIQDVQTIITCTGIEDFLNKNDNIYSIYKVDNGNIEKVTKCFKE